VQEIRRIGRTAAARDALYISIVLGKAQGKNKENWLYFFNIKALGYKLAKEERKKYTKTRIMRLKGKMNKNKVKAFIILIISVIGIGIVFIPNSWIGLFNKLYIMFIILIVDCGLVISVKSSHNATKELK